MRYHVIVKGRVFFKTNSLDAALLCASVHGGKVKDTE